MNPYLDEAIQRSFRLPRLHLNAMTAARGSSTAASRTKKKPPLKKSTEVASSAATISSPAQAKCAQKQQASTSPANPDLLAQADAIVRMTYELNMRAVSAQAERLEQDMRKLVQSTGTDREFRDQHERRLQELWKEIGAVKENMSQIQGSQEDIKTDHERRCRETSDSIESFRQEILGVRELVSSVSVLLDQLPAFEEISDESTLELQSSPSGVETRAMQRARQCAKQKAHKLTSLFTLQNTMAISF
jgi:hypothetical protein